MSSHNDYSKHTRDSMAPGSLCVAWLYDGLGMQQQQQSVCGPTACRAHSYA